MPVSFNRIRDDANVFWLTFGAILVFFMQCGFAMLEVGSVQIKNTKNILIKNIFDASIGALIWWWWGFGIAMGRDKNNFVGESYYGMKWTDSEFDAHEPEEGNYDERYAMWLFQWAFAATATTIVSGAVAERVSFPCYLMYSVIITSVIYPFVVHWTWHPQGWASAFRDPTVDGSDSLLFDCGVIDFAGSGVVHLTGGVAALVACLFIGPRNNRFNEIGEPMEIPGQSPVYQTLGTLILWFGWYGFNGVSTLYIAYYGHVAAKVMVNTTISAASGAIACVIFGRLLDGVIDNTRANNGILAGLVAITAGCSVVEPVGAFIIGTISSLVYLYSNHLLLKFRVDDVVGAFPVHGANGIWGVLAAGLFASELGYARAYYADRMTLCCGVFYGCYGKQFGANLVFVLVVVGWVAFMSTCMFALIKYTVGVRVSEDVEYEGMDASKHGGRSMMHYVLDPSMGPGSAPPGLYPDDGGSRRHHHHHGSRRGMSSRRINSLASNQSGYVAGGTTMARAMSHSRMRAGSSRQLVASSQKRVKQGGSRMNLMESQQTGSAKDLSALEKVGGDRGVQLYDEEAKN